MKTTRDLVVVRAAYAPEVVDLATHRDADQDTVEQNDVQSTEDSDGQASDEMPVMTVRFSVFGTWYPIRSFWEGQFMERVMHGAFRKTIAERGSSVKVMFNHGMEFCAPGEMVLGVPSLLEERSDSPYAEVPLLDTSYNRDLVEGLRAGAYGSSFTFQVIRDEWYEPDEPSEHNPQMWPERSILEVRLMEFGPVSWPANPAATSGLRCGTDWYADRIRSRRPEQFPALSERFASFRAEHGLCTPEFDAATRGTSDDVAAVIPTDAPDITHVVHHPNGLSKHARSRVLAAPFLDGKAHAYSTEGAA